MSNPGMWGHGLATRTKAGPRWTGRVELVPSKLDLPLHWKRPRRIFVNSTSDLFHEALSDLDINRVFARMARAPQHTYQILTKRPGRAREWFDWASVANYTVKPWPLPNVWVGVSVEDQATADERIPLLLQTPAVLRWVSYEPALGPVDFRMGGMSLPEFSPHRPLPDLDWIVVGGESGPGARPFDVAWARSTVAQCKSAGVAVFVKQLGAQPLVEPGRLRYWEWGGEIGREDDPRFTPTDPMNPSSRPWRVHLNDRKGGDMTEWPRHLRVRELPGGAA
jgi:protein gp37